MADLELNVDSDAVCDPADVTGWQGTYFGNLYVVGMDGLLQRHHITLGRTVTVVSEPEAIMSRTRERAVSGTLDIDIPPERLVALSIIRFCWHERHTFEGGRGFAVERAASIAVGSSVLPMEKAVIPGAYSVGAFRRPNGETEIRRNPVIDGPVVNLPIASPNSPVDFVTRTFVRTGLRDLPYYVLLHGRPGGFVEDIIPPQVTY